MNIHLISYSNTCLFSKLTCSGFFLKVLKKISHYNFKCDIYNNNEEPFFYNIESWKSTGDWRQEAG